MTARGALLFAFALLAACSKTAEPESTLNVLPLGPSIVLKTVPVLVEPGGMKVSATPGNPAVLRNLAPRTSYEARVRGEYLAEPVEFTTDEHGRASAELEVMPITNQPAEPRSPGGRPEARAEIHFDGPNGRRLIWKRDVVVLAEVQLPPQPAPLARALREQWVSSGSHRDPADPARDELAVYMEPETPPARVLETCRAALSVQREFRSHSGTTQGAAFAVSVRPKPPAAAVPGASIQAPSPKQLALAERYAAPVNSLGARLYRELAASPGNINLSPLSVAAALGMAEAGADGATEAELSTVLKVPGGGSTVSEGLGALLGTCRWSGMRNGGEPALRVADGIWVQQGRPLTSTFARTIARDYGGRATLVDFASDPTRAARTINDWVARGTGGRITDAVPESAIGARTRAVLVNAVYFKAAWHQPFLPRATQLQEFHLATGATVQVPTMRMAGEIGYAVARDYRAVRLAYDVPGFSMVLVLPNDHALARVERQLDRVVAEALGRFEQRAVRLSLPKLKFRWGSSLVPALRSVGVRAALGPDASFTKMTGDRSVRISEVLQATTLQVDELGTEATASTSGFASGVGRISDAIELRFDRPHLFAIVEQSTGTIVFLGRVSDPRARN